MRVVGCFLEHDDKFLILLRHSHKPDGNTWGLPSGKVEANESDIDAVLREVFEETGYRAKSSELEHIGDFNFVSSSNVPYVYPTYRIRLANPHKVELEQVAHSEYAWVSPEECYSKTDLIPAFHELLVLTGYIK
ncbi:MAG: NUDIX hydrolase [Candidatus Saccharimonadales bacterium]